MDRAEAAGLGVSAVGHLALLAILSFALVRVGTRPVPPAALEVSFVDDVGPTSAAPQPAAQAPAIGAAPEAGPVENSAPEPMPAPAPQQPPAAVAPEPAAPPQRPLARQAPVQPSPRPGTRTRISRPLTGAILEGIGDDRASTSDRPPATMTGEARASINAAIRRALIPCQRQALPAPEAAAIKVNVRVSLNRDGSLARAEVTSVDNPNPSLQIYERRMQDLALDVLHRCTPIRGLPADLYDVPRGWRQFPYQFDPRTR